MLDETYWSQRYIHGQTGWDIGYPSTPLKEYIDQLDNKHISILIPGAGYGSEVKYLAEQAFANVAVVDISSKPYQHENYDLPKSCGYHLLVDDFFKHEGQYDLIIEQTFFCALDPALREQYVNKTHSLLTDTGKLVGVLFNRLFEKQGPPFGGLQSDYQSLFGNTYSEVYISPCYNSIPPRQDSELFIKSIK